MAHYGLLRDYRFDDEGTADDIRGAKIYGQDDEKLGKIDDVIFDHATGNIRYVVVDAGGWLSSKRFLVPAHQIRASQKHKDDFEISATKDQIERFPEYKESDLESDEDWKNYEKRYKEPGTTARCSIAKVRTTTSLRRRTKCRKSPDPLAASSRPRNRQSWIRASFPRAPMRSPLNRVQQG